MSPEWARAVRTRAWASLPALAYPVAVVMVRASMVWVLNAAMRMAWVSSLVSVSRICCPGRTWPSGSRVGVGRGGGVQFGAGGADRRGDGVVHLVGDHRGGARRRGPQREQVFVAAGLCPGQPGPRGLHCLVGLLLGRVVHGPVRVVIGDAVAVVRVQHEVHPRVAEVVLLPPAGTHRKHTCPAARSVREVRMCSCRPVPGSSLLTCRSVTCPASGSVSSTGIVTVVSANSNVRVRSCSSVWVWVGVCRGKWFCRTFRDAGRGCRDALGPCLVSAVAGCCFRICRRW